MSVLCGLGEALGLCFGIFGLETQEGFLLVTCDWKAVIGTTFSTIWIRCDYLGSNGVCGTRRLSFGSWGRWEWV